MVAEMANDDTVDADRIMEVIASGSGLAGPERGESAA
jgi:hypothetical protein